MIHLEKDGAAMDIALKGAELRAYRDADGRERLWSGNPKVWAGVAPTLFPCIGALKDGRVSIGGVEYQIPRHGFARTGEFRLAERGEDYAALTLSQTDETRRVYPFDFAFTTTHRFVAGGFETVYTVENHSQKTMPFAIGGHAGFACPMKPGERFEDYVLRFEKPERGETMLVSPEHLLEGVERVDLGADQRTLRLNYADYDRLDTYVFAGLNSRSVELLHKDTGKGIRVFFDGMETLAVWTMPDAHAPYLCIEPWQGLPACAGETGRFEDKPYHVELEAGKAYRCGYGMVAVA